MTSANKLTLFRLILTPLFVILLMINNLYTKTFALFIFIIQMITDVLDGRLARKKNQVTNYGKFVDPIVDKILVISALVLFIEMGIVPAWIVILIISREFLIVGLRLIIKDIKIVEASFLGKLKTATQMLGISFILIILLLKDFYNTNLFDIVTYLIILIMMVVTLASGINYLIKNREFILELKYK